MHVKTDTVAKQASLDIETESVIVIICMLAILFGIAVVVLIVRFRRRRDEYHDIEFGHFLGEYPQLEEIQTFQPRRSQRLRQQRTI